MWVASADLPRSVGNPVCDRLNRVLNEAGFVKGQTIGIDATTLEANAALRSIMRRGMGKGDETFLQRLAAASGIATPTRAELARLDPKGPKRGTNASWTHPHDPDVKIAKVKDGRTHMAQMAQMAEHAVDLETCAVVDITVQDADAGDTTMIVETQTTAAERIEAVLPAGGLAEMVGSNETLVALADLGIHSHVSEPAHGRRCW